MRLPFATPSEILSPHGYVLYIGIAGRRSDRALRERYKDYLNVKQIQKVRRRTHMRSATGKTYFVFILHQLMPGFHQKTLKGWRNESIQR